jgi:polyhydroxyalkanoate synthesis regulator phasin
MSDAKEQIVGVFMYEDQLELILEALAYFGGNAYMSEEKLSDVDDLMVQLEEGKMVQEEGEMVAYYASEDDKNVH